jgi:membrane-associated phospholipid phosphatase
VGAAALGLNARLRPLDAAELAALDADGLFGPDRGATGRWSPGAATASDHLRLALAAAPLLLLADDDGSGSGETLALMYAETLLLEQAVTGAIKGLARRPRPFTYNPDPRIPDELRRSRHAVRSFPSGHASTAFAAAVFAGEIYARRHPDDPGRHWVRGGGLAAAAGVAWLRVRAGRHFPTDVLAGAVVGAVVGWGVPRLHEVDREEGGGGEGARPLIAWRFSF